MTADTIFNVIFTLYLGSFTWLLLVIKKSSDSQVHLIKEQIAQKDATIEHLEHVIKKLYEDTDPVKWKARLDLNKETLEEEITRLKQQKDSASQEKVTALEVVKGLTTEILATRQMLTESQNQYNDSIIASGSVKLEKLGATASAINSIGERERKRKLMAKFGIT